MERNCNIPYLPKDYHPHSDHQGGETNGIMLLFMMYVSIYLSRLGNVDSLIDEEGEVPTTPDHLHLEKPALTICPSIHQLPTKSIVRGVGGLYQVEHTSAAIDIWYCSSRGCGRWLVRFLSLFFLYFLVSKTWWMGRSIINEQSFFFFFSFLMDGAYICGVGCHLLDSPCM